MERRIAAILAADMVGYSTLIERDETGTLSRQKALRAGLIAPTIRRHNGNIVKLTGDGFLAEFKSTASALRCARILQTEITRHESQADEEISLQYRMAVHIGDIIRDEGDIYGEGVNIAARLEGLAPPGGIAISGPAHDVLQNAIDMDFVDQGEKRLKNIETPVRVFHVMPNGAARPTPKPVWSWPLTACVVLILAIALWVGAPPQATMSLQDPDAVSIVVLPFDNISGDAEQDHFAHGLTEDITTDLSQLPKLSVISRNAALAFSRQHADPRKALDVLGARYVVTGSVRRINLTMRITMTLVDSRTGAQLWARRYDGPHDKVLAFQDHAIADLLTVLPLHLNSKNISNKRPRISEDPARPVTPF